ncbi:hypothetical protein SAMN05216316_0611 [Nitrosovibrio sp. Nv6]|nr:hypothetical protein SAMN05216316_0611 [Nitrosovibrio sp. Nv6]
MKLVRSGLTSAWLAQLTQIVLLASTGMRNKNTTPELLARVQRVCCRIRIQLAFFPLQHVSGLPCPAGYS